MMMRMGVRRLRFVVVVSILVVLGNTGGSMGEVECNVDLPTIVDKCKPYVVKEGPKINPSEDCCKALKGADIPCLCQKITPVIEGAISVEKGVFVARFCGLDVPTGIKCGSYTVPPPGSPPAPLLN